MDGWVKSTDPRTGRTFYANHITRKTQWEAPPGWIDDDDDNDKKSEDAGSVAATSAITGGWGGGGGGGFGGGGSTTSREYKKSSSNSSFSTLNTYGSNSYNNNNKKTDEKKGGGGDDDDDELPLPPGWEKMHDKASGRPFYVDHARKITTWEHPARSEPPPKKMESSSNSSSNKKKNGFGFSSSASSRTSGGGLGYSEASSAAYHPPPRKTNTIAANIYDSLPSTTTPASTAFHQSSITSTSTTDASFSYYDAHRTTESALPPLEFKTVIVPDELRPSCPSCSVFFSLPLKRRHHCRLCGDVYCDGCSAHRCLLPLDGPQFEKPVRVCDGCFVDVEKQNYFSTRRYLTPLLLFDPDNKDMMAVGGSSSGDNEDELGPRQCAAALSALTSDLDEVLQDCTQFQEKITITADLLVPAIARHLHHRSTSDRAIRALSSLLALGNLVGDDSFAQAVYMIGGSQVLDAILALLEWSGSAKKTLAVQEQAARALFYLSDGNVIKGLLNMSSGSEMVQKSLAALKAAQKKEEEEKERNGDTTTTGSTTISTKIVVNPVTSVENLDIHRTLRNCLDHTTTSASPSLQRWSAASLRNLITEDQRRALNAASESAETGGSAPLRYESFTSQLVSSGGVMILCSLIGAEDADTRAHATAALSATIGATRAVDASQAMLREMRGEGVSGNSGGGGSTSDANIVEAIVSGGGCGSSLAQLLLSADDTVAGMGCSFASSLVTPLLTNPRGSVLIEGGMAQSAVGGAKGDCNEDGMAAYREAGFALATEKGGCLPALVQLLRDPNTGGSVVRPVELRKCAMETLASICLAVSYKAGGPDAVPENEKMGLAREAVERLEEEQASHVALAVLSALGSQNLISDNDSPTSQLREAAGIVLKAMASCSTATLSLLRSNRAMTVIVAAASEEGMMGSSSLRAEWAPRLLGMLETSAIIMHRAWTHSRCKSEEDGKEEDLDSPPTMMGSDSYYGAEGHMDQYGNSNGSGNGGHHKSNLDLLLEAIDAGAIPLASRVVCSKIEFHDQPKACGNIRAKIACCRLLSAMFGIARSDDTSIGVSRLYNAIDSDLMTRSSGGGGGGGGGGWRGSNGGSNLSPGEDLVALTVSLLQSTISHAQHNLMTGGSGDLPLPDLVDACLCAVGSMCGATISSSVAKMEDVQLSTDDFGLAPEDDFSSRRHDACSAACDVLVTDARSNSFLPAVVVGGFGEGSVLSALRLVLAVVQNGPAHLHPKLAESGVLIPLGDTLRSAFSAGERYNFSTALALIRFCGPHISVGSVDSGIMVSLRDSIRIISSVIVINEDENTEESQLETLRALKAEGLLALESLSSNASLWGAITSFAVPSISEFLQVNQDWDPNDSRFAAVLCAALRTVQRVIPIPSHAIATARAGMGASLAGIICGSEISSQTDENNSEDDVQELSLEVLHSLASHSTARRGDDNGTIGLVHCGAVDAACVALTNSALISKDKLPETTDSRAEKMTKFGLETLQFLLTDLDVSTSSAGPPLSKQDIDLMQTAFVESVARNTDCIKTLIATLLLPDNTSNANMNGKTDSFTQLYGYPLALYDGPCASFANPKHAAISTLFSMAFYCSSETSGVGEPFWETFLMEMESNTYDKRTQQAAAVAASAAFLDVLMNEEDGICCPQKPASQGYYFDVALPQVRKCLLEGLQSNLAKHLDSPTPTDEEGENPRILPLLSRFAVPRVCLALCRDSQLQDKAFQIFEGLVGVFSDEFLPLLTEDKGALIALFNMMGASSKIDGGSSGKQIRRRITQILGDLTGRGLLGTSVEKLKLRDKAILSLSAAFLVDEDYDDDDEDDGYHDPKAFTTLCLESLVAVLSAPLVNASAKEKEKWSFLKSVHDTMLRMTPAEAKKMSSTLGKKLSNMVLERFLEHTDENEFDKDISRHEAIENAPEVVILCALASSKEALPELCSNGGLEALSIVAADGQISAIAALHEVCKENPSAVLKVDGHISIMDVLTVEESDTNQTNKSTNRSVQSCCLDLLVTLCKTSKKTRMAVVNAEQCERLVSVASDAVSSLASVLRGDTVDSDSSAHAEDTEVSEEEKGPSPPEYESITSKPANDDIAAEEKKSSESGVDWDGDSTLEVSALLLLIELVRSKSCRKIFMGNLSLLQACSWLASHSPSLEIQYVSVNFLANIAPFLSREENDDCFSVSSLASIFCEILSGTSSPKQNSRLGAVKLTTKKQSSTEQEINKNMVLAAAVAGVESIFSTISPLVKAEIISNLSSSFIQIIDNFTGVPKWGGRKTKLEENSALLACSMSSLFVLVLGSEISRDSIQEPELLSAMIRLIIVVRDAEIKAEIKGANEFKDREIWCAVQTHCLFCVSSVARSIVSTDDDALEEMVEKAESAYRSAKQPRSESRRTFLPKKELPRKESTEVLTFESVLSTVADCKGNGANSVAAKRILALLSS